MSQLRSLSEVKSDIAKMSAEAEALKPSVDEYYRLHREMGELQKQVTRREREHRLSAIICKTDFQEPSLPSFGSAGEEGCATFETTEDMKELCEALNAGLGYGLGYYYNHWNWKGPGLYFTVTQHRRDHDGDDVFTIQWRKADDGFPT